MLLRLPPIGRGALQKKKTERGTPLPASSTLYCQQIYNVPAGDRRNVPRVQHQNHQTAKEDGFGVERHTMKSSLDQKGNINACSSPVFRTRRFPRKFSDGWNDSIVVMVNEIIRNS